MSLSTIDFCTKCIKLVSLALTMIVTNILWIMVPYGLLCTLIAVASFLFSTYLLYIESQKYLDVHCMAWVDPNSTMLNEILTNIYILISRPTSACVAIESITTSAILRSYYAVVILVIIVLLVLLCLIIISICDSVPLNRTTLANSSSTTLTNYVMKKSVVVEKYPGE